MFNDCKNYIIIIFSIIRLIARRNACQDFPISQEINHKQIKGMSIHQFDQSDQFSSGDFPSEEGTIIFTELKTPYFLHCQCYL